jgi:hypothetical protein
MPTVAIRLYPLSSFDEWPACGELTQMPNNLLSAWSGWRENHLERFFCRQPRLLLNLLVELVDGGGRNDMDTGCFAVEQPGESDLALIVKRHAYILELKRYDSHVGIQDTLNQLARNYHRSFMYLKSCYGVVSSTPVIVVGKPVSKNEWETALGSRAANHLYSLAEKRPTAIYYHFVRTPRSMSKRFLLLQPLCTPTTQPTDLEPNGSVPKEFLDTLKQNCFRLSSNKLFWRYATDQPRLVAEVWLLEGMVYVQYVLKGGGKCWFSGHLHKMDELNNELKEFRQEMSGFQLQPLEIGRHVISYWTSIPNLYAFKDRDYQNLDCLLRWLVRKQPG